MDLTRWCLGINSFNRVQLAEALHVSPVSLMQGSETLVHPASSVSPAAEESRYLGFNLTRSRVAVFQRQ